MHDRHTNHITFIALNLTLYFVLSCDTFIIITLTFTFTKIIIINEIVLSLRYTSYGHS